MMVLVMVMIMQLHVWMHGWMVVMLMIVNGDGVADEWKHGW
jgi:hypothetical protein